MLVKVLVEVAAVHARLRACHLSNFARRRSCWWRWRRSVHARLRVICTCTTFRILPGEADHDADAGAGGLTVRFDSIVVLAGGRRRCIGLGGVGFAPSNEDLAFRAGVCHLMNLFLRTMFKLRQVGPIFETFFWPLSRRILFENDPDFGTILVPFFGPGTLPGNGFLPFAR